MPPIKRTCVKCAEEFVLMPGKPGFANVCPECSAPAPALAPVSREVKKVVRKRRPMSAKAFKRSLLKSFRDLLELRRKS
ncbi:MAG: hypothetical protein ACRDQZ_11845 [Mycobacteriales bacterium]